MSGDLHLGIYAHHHGAGHWHRAQAIAAAFPGRTTVLTSRVPDRLSGTGLDVVALPPDGGATGSATPAVLHHAPLRDDGLRARMARIASWLGAARPDAVLVDVSVEVATLVRLHGVPTAVVRQPGRRDDPAHRLGYDLADLVLAPWGEPGERDGTVHVGLVSRFDRAPRRFGCVGDDRTRVVVAVGAGGSRLRREDLVALREALPGDHRIDVLGRAPWEPVPGVCGGTWVHDPWSVLVGADVVVASGSLNLVGEVAAAGVPLVVVPEERPHDEQVEHARVLADTWDVPVAGGWGPGLAACVRRALAEGPRRLSDRRGADRAAELLEKLAVTA